MSRLTNLKSQFPNIDKTIIDILQYADPSDRYTYSEFLLKQLKKTFFEEKNTSIVDFRYELTNSFGMKKSVIDSMSNLEVFMFFSLTHMFLNRDSIKTLNKFHEMRLIGQMDSVDITAIRDFNEMANLVSLVELKNIGNELSRQVVKCYEDDKWLVLLPLTHLASKKYGFNTRWCTTSETHNYFKKYASTGVLIYTINKKRGYKVATYNHLFEKELSFWNAEDRRIDSMEADLPNNIMDEIKKIIKEVKTPNMELLSPEDLKKELEYYGDNEKNDSIINQLIEPIPMEEAVQVNIPVNIPLRLPE